MGLQELEPSQYILVKTLMGATAAAHLSIEAVMTRNAEGSIVVDDVAEPKFAILDGPEGTYLLARDGLSEELELAVAAHLADWAYLHLACETPISKLALPNQHMLLHRRLVFSLPVINIAPPSLPEGYVLERVDDFGHRIQCGGIEVARCLPDVVVNERAEIGVWTHPGHRRRGLAGVALRATLNAAHESGIRSIGWHCHASNKGSIALARSVGAGDPVHSCAFSASLPAENGSDLNVEEWIRLAEHFEAGRDEIVWLGFHAACAWSAAGRQDEALRATERLVEDGWQGQTDWLTGHWALAQLAEHSRMQRAIARLRCKGHRPIRKVPSNIL